jgi:putative ABC transport system substrate-binding protein
MRRFAATVPVLLVVLLVFASAAATQPAPKVARVGMLCDPLCNVSYNNAFVDELRKLGWVEGTTIVIERKDPDYRLDLLPALAPTSCDRNPISSSPSLLKLCALQRTRPRTYQL